MSFVPWLVFVLAALLEVGGDALMRRGLRGGGVLFIRKPAMDKGAD